MSELPSHLGLFKMYHYHLIIGLSLITVLTHPKTIIIQNQLLSFMH